MSAQDFKLIDCRVLYRNSQDKVIEYDRFVTPCVPHEGEYINIQGRDCEIYHVSWMIINHWPQVNVYVLIE